MAERLYRVHHMFLTGQKVLLVNRRLLSYIHPYIDKPIKLPDVLVEDGLACQWHTVDIMVRGGKIVHMWSRSLVGAH